MKKNILIADDLIRDYTQIYSKHFKIDTLWNIKGKKINFSKYDALVASGLFKITPLLMKNLKNIKIISLFAVGYDNVDLVECKKRKITVSNTPGVLTRDVADLALTLLLSISRNIVNGQSYIKSNLWQKNGPMKLTDSIFNKKIGIVGLGKIGKEFAKKAESLSMEINYFGPRKKISKYKYFKNLNQMAKYVDYLVITCAGGEKTKKLISKSVITSMKKSSYLINVSRGTVIDEKALINSLKNNKIKGAALDVFYNEPKINPIFKKLNNVIIHPHHGSGTVETRNAMAQLSCQNLINFFKKGKPLHKVI